MTGSKWKPRAALCGMALVAYANSFGLGLTTDARKIVTQDRRVHEVSWENLNLILTRDYWWPTSTDRLYRPVTMLSYLMNYAVMGSGEAAAGYHAINFLLHVGNIWLVYELGLLALGGAQAAFLAAAAWAVHPVNTECVTNVAGRADLLSALGILAGLLLYIRIAKTPGRGGWPALLALFAAALFAAFAKENGAVLLALMLLWDLSLGTGAWTSLRKRAPAYAAVAAALVLLLWMRYRVFDPLPWPEMPFVPNPIAAANFWAARLTAIKVIGMYLWLLVCPWQLSSDHSYNQIPIAGWPDWAAWLSLLAVAAILGLAIARRRKDRLMFWAAGFAGLALLPMSNLLFLIGTNMAERFLYLPSMAFTVAVVEMLYRLQPYRAAAILAALITIYAARTLARNPAWNDNLSLAASDVRTAPGSVGLHGNLAEALFEQEPKANIDRVIQEAETAWAMLRPLPPERIFQNVPANLGAYYRYKADLVGGLATPEGLAWYGRARATLQRAREAAQAGEKSYDRAQLAHGKPLAKRASVPLVYFNLAAINATLGRYDEALEAYLYGRNLNPASVQPYGSIAAVYQAKGSLGLAAITILEKMELEGSQTGTIPALLSLYAGIPDAGCAVKQAVLDPECPRLRSDLCSAWQDLAQAFDEARQPARAAEFRAKRAGGGCSDR